MHYVGNLKKLSVMSLNKKTINSVNRIKTFDSHLSMRAVECSHIHAILCKGVVQNNSMSSSKLKHNFEQYRDEM